MAIRKFLALLLTISLLPIGTPAQSGKKTDAPSVVITKAPPETPEQLAARKLALQEMLQRLTTTGRIMQVVAHPDDEDGAMLTLESRVKGNTAMLFTFTRGEGGQNAQGAVFFDELGILRTLELLAADKEYGAEERFSHFADFGFSKSADETYEKWGSRKNAEADLVGAIRDFAPDVVVARFSGTPKDGHGHHQASAQLTLDAVQDAPRWYRNDACCTVTPPILKIYTGLAGDEATLVPDESQPSPLLNGKTPEQVALEGLRHQESQGLGNIERRGPRPKLYSSYKLVQMPGGFMPPAKDADFFSGIDTSLPALYDRFPLAGGIYLNLRDTMVKVAAAVKQAQAAAEVSPDNALPALVLAQKAFDSLQRNKSGQPDQVHAVNVRIDQIRSELTKALNLAAGVKVEYGRARQDASKRLIALDEDVPLSVRVTNVGSHELLNTAAYFGPTVLSLFPKLSTGETAEIQFNWKELHRIDRVGFHRESPAKDSIYKLDGPEPFKGDALEDMLASKASHEVKFLWSVDGVTIVADPTPSFFVVPAISLQTVPNQVLRLLKSAHSQSIDIEYSNIGENPVRGVASLVVPQGWTVTPETWSLNLDGDGMAKAKFVVHWPENALQSQSMIKAKFNADGKTYTDDITLISRPDLPDAFPYYAPAQTTISLIDAEISERHNIGYIMGAGDTLPDDLRSLGFDVHLLNEADLATGDLAQYDSIMTGVRAYATRADLRAHNQRLLDYVKQGGTFIVQYEQDFSAFNSGHYTPFPATMGRDRVSQEEQPVKILDPESSILRYPNRITNADFDNWVQERGLYFMKEWSSDYTPLLSMNDVGESPLEGGLLVAHYGKGTYIYTGLSFYRELPNGVPGAARLLINLLAAGHNPAEQPAVNARK